MKVLLIGYGSIGRRHAEILASFPGAGISLVSRQSGTPWPAFPSLEAVPDIGSFDYYVIASETHKHRDHLRFLLERLKGKTILVEKPVFDRLDPTDGPGGIDPGANRVYVAYNLRFHALMRALKERLRGRRVLYAHAVVGQYLPTWRPGTDYRASYSAKAEAGGGALLDLSHEIDYAQWLCGRIVSAQGIAAKVSGLEITSDDLATAVCCAESGAVINLSMDYLSRLPIRRVLVHSEDATFLADLVGGTLDIGTGGGKPEHLEFPGLDRNHSYLGLHKAVLEDGGGDCCTLREGLDVLAAADMIRNSGGSRT